MNKIIHKMESFRATIADGNVDQIRQLAPTLLTGYNFSTRSQVLYPLAIEPTTNVEAIVQLLIELGFDPLIASFSAIKTWSFNNLVLLIEAIPNLNLIYNRSFILLEAMKNHDRPLEEFFQIVELLLKRGADPNLVIRKSTEPANTALGQCFENGAMSAVSKLLTAYGADWEVLRARGIVTTIARHLIEDYFPPAKLSLIFEQGLDLNLDQVLWYNYDRKNIYAELDFDTRNGYLQVLFEGGALPSRAMMVNYLMAGQPDEALIARPFNSERSPFENVDVDGVDFESDYAQTTSPYLSIDQWTRKVPKQLRPLSRGWSYFHYLASKGYRMALKYYLDHPELFDTTANELLNSVDQYGRSPIFHAITHNHALTVYLLLDYGADLLLVDRDGLTVFDLFNFEPEFWTAAGFYRIAVRVKSAYRTQARNRRRIEVGGHDYRAAARSSSLIPSWYRPILQPEVARFRIKQACLTNKSDLLKLALEYGVPIREDAIPEICDRLHDAVDLASPTDFSNYYDYKNPARFYLSDEPKSTDQLKISDGDGLVPNTLSPLRSPAYLAGFVIGWDRMQNSSPLRIYIVVQLGPSIDGADLTYKTPSDFMHGYPQPQHWWTIGSQFMGNGPNGDRGIFHFPMVTGDNIDQLIDQIGRETLTQVGERHLIVRVAGSQLFGAYSYFGSAGEELIAGLNSALAIQGLDQTVISPPGRSIYVEID